MWAGGSRAEWAEGGWREVGLVDGSAWEGGWNVDPAWVEWQHLQALGWIWGRFLILPIPAWAGIVPLRFKWLAAGIS